jgi:ATP-dependent Clp protease ATP-binding subunit ClpB
MGRKVRQLEIEREVIKKENDKAKMDHVNEKLANAKQKLDSLTARWKNEKEVVDTIQSIKKQIDDLEVEADKAERDSDFEKVARIRYGELKEKQVHAQSS